eukprot:Skav222265  [mRNA]  locus=scaffold2459:8971:29084:+ [translate_table: standard]
MFTVSFFARIGFSAAWMFITNFTHSLPWNEFLAQDPGRTWPILHNVMALVLGGKHRWNEMLFHDVHHAFPNAVGTLSQRGRFHGWEKVHDAAAEVLHRGLWKPNGDEETQMQKTQKKRSLMMKQNKSWHVHWKLRQTLLTLQGCRQRALALLATSEFEEAQLAARAAFNAASRLRGQKRVQSQASALEQLVEAQRLGGNFQAMTQAAEETADSKLDLSRWVAMDIRSSIEHPVMGHFSTVVHVDQRIGNLHFGTEAFFGTRVAFAYEGDAQGYQTLYHVRRSEAKLEEYHMLVLDSDRPPLRSNPPQAKDFLYAHDVCSGLGGFSTAVEFLGGRPVSAVDFSPLALSAFELNHSCPSLLADIKDDSVVFEMHRLQLTWGAQPAVFAGFPCQPLSIQGDQAREHDLRSRTLPAVLRAGRLLRACALVLECVPEALRDPFTQACLREFCEVMEYQLVQRIIPLHTCWPSKRTRWFAALAPFEFAPHELLPLPIISPSPVVNDLIAATHWPIWSQHDEEQLAWDPLELQVYHDADFGNPDRRVVLTQPLPTALHSWGVALRACPCGCRSSGLNADRLRARGLRGISVVSGLWPHAERHIHPQELMMLLGFPAFQKTLDDCRAQICLLGNSVSPIHGVWVWSQVLDGLGLLSAASSPSAALSQYVDRLMFEQELTWPSRCADISHLELDFGETMVDVQFNTSQQVADLLAAEKSLHGCLRAQLACDGVVLPPHAFLQARRYQVLNGDESGFPFGRTTTFTLDLFGVSHTVFVPDMLTYDQALRGLGIGDVVGLVDHNGSLVRLTDRVVPWRAVTVQSDVAAISLDLALREEGLGYLPQSPPGIRMPESCVSTGLWKLDEILRSQVLMSWFGAGCPSLALWLPSFSTAVLDSWPGIMSEQVESWNPALSDTLHVFVLEYWGWNYATFTAVGTALSVLKFTDQCISACLHRLIGQVRDTWGFGKVVFTDGASCSLDGSLGAALEALDFQLGIPCALTQRFRQERSRFHDCLVGLDSDAHICSPTLSMQMPFQGEEVPMQVTRRFGLTGKFLLHVAKSWIATSPFTVTPQQVQAVCLDSLSEEACLGTLSGLSASDSPLLLFVLVDKHWTLLYCRAQEDTLKVTHFDGLARTCLWQISPVCLALKTAWKLRKVKITSTWTFPQTQPHTCGTIALAHFAHLLGLISYNQACDFEDNHDGLAMCGLHPQFHGLVGYGVEDAAIISSLSQILPGKGVPDKLVKERGEAAIKAFGAEAIHKALGQRNPWTALKQLGNSKPRPFMWVTHAELQDHIKDRARSKFGADLDTRRPKKSKDTRKPIEAQQIDPAQLQLPKDVFTTNDGSSLQQISLAQVQKNARGIAFAAPQDVMQFLTDGKLISPEGLNVLVVGTLPEGTPQSLPMTPLRVPAMYRGTNEPIILECTSLQLGDQAVYRKVNVRAPEIAVFPTVVFRAHIYKDEWSEEHTWESLVVRPLKSLISQFDPLNLCRDPSCNNMCDKYHPAIEEAGVESAVLNVWAFRWTSLDGSKAHPEKAAVLSLYMRLPESNFDVVHELSGSCGVYFEPRHKEQPGPDDRFAVVWLTSGLSETVHRVKAIDECITVCRLGSKYGVRCLVKHQEEVHKSLCPNKPFVKCSIRCVFRLEPLPAGTQRSSLVDMLQAAGWVARPLQPCKGSQGKAWEVGAEAPPPCPFLEAKHGWISVSKIRDQGAATKPSDLIATAKTRMHIQHSSSSQASGSQDPWQQADPWGGYQPTTGPAVRQPPSTHVQQKFDDVEQKLTYHVAKTIEDQVGKAVEAFTGDEEARTRLQSVEQQLLSMAQHQGKLEHEHHQLVNAVHACNAQVHAQGETITHVASEAAVPGPVDFDTYMSPPSWTFPSCPDFCLGIGNPSGLSNKLHMLESFPEGWWHMSETQLSRHQQSAFQGFLRSLSYRTGRCLRSSLGAPAPLRPGSSTSGSWTGVLSFGDCPLRDINVVWPSGAYVSGRVKMCLGYVHNVPITTATLYCPAKGPTFPNSKELSEALLETVTSELVCGREGPRAVLGDFNHEPGSLTQMKVWQQWGWIEIQDLFHQIHGVQQRPTCKSATRPDQIWLSPEMVPLICNLALWQVFPDHDMLIAGLSIPSASVVSMHWVLPGHIPWTAIDHERWTCSSDLVPSASSLWTSPSSPDLDENCSTEWLHTWSANFEKAASQCMSTPAARADTSFFGRGANYEPKPRAANAPIVRSSRPGEVAQSCSLLNRAVAKWFRQLRRLQSYRHAASFPRAADTEVSRSQLWSSIVRAPGFVNGFANWWTSRPVRTQGPPLVFPLWPPSAEIAELIYLDFLHNYRSFEAYQHRRRRDSCEAKLLSSTKQIFSVTRRPAKAPLDSLIDEVAQAIQVVDGGKGLISVPEPFPSENIVEWSLQGMPATVTSTPDGYEVDSDLLLIDGQQLTCKMKSNPTIRDWWGMFSTADEGDRSNGPFGKFISELHSLGLQLDEDFQLWLSEKASLDFLHCSEDFLKKVLLGLFRNTVTVELRNRAGYEDLEGIDYGATTALDHALLPQDRSALHIVRDGAFFTNNMLCKFDTRISPLCPDCGVPDSRTHRYNDCVRYRDLRDQHSEARADWSQLPACFRNHGLVPDNPWRILAWEALVQLPPLTEEYWLEPHQGSLQIFTDGACTEPSCPELSLAAWSVIWAGHGTVACGPLPGLQQCIARAELMAVLVAIRWCSLVPCTLHLWIDSQTVADDLRALLRNAASPEAFAHSDLWHLVAQALSTTLAEVLVHKIPSHDKVDSCQSPVEDYARTWNSVADHQAMLANHHRPPIFKKIWRKYEAYYRTWSRRAQQLQRFHLAVAHRDEEIGQTARNDDEEPPEFVSNFVYSSCLQEIAAQFATLKQEDGLIFSPAHCSHFRAVAHRLMSWLIDIDGSATRQRAVSLLELYVAYRLEVAGVSPVSSSIGLDDRFLVVTFAADYGFFKKVCRYLFSFISVTTDEISLAFLQVFQPQSSVQIGWDAERESHVFDGLRDFIGKRPVTSAQALAKPWRPKLPMEARALRLCTRGAGTRNSAFAPRDDPGDSSGPLNPWQKKG